MKARRNADKMFYHACRVGGCSPRQALLLYLGVRIGAILKIRGAWYIPRVQYLLVDPSPCLDNVL